ncbi:MAG: hypothetical protein D6677_02410 [Calditrichaeota bacterium]|nr:MAG: hypothetical protein D6677_02410 [Calditrichota bacterium]
MTIVTRVSALLFIHLYLLLLLKPFMPYIEYELNKAYIASTLCVNKDKPEMHCEGRCHLKKELQKVHDETTDEHNNTALLPGNLDNFPNFILTTPSIVPYLTWTFRGYSPITQRLHPQHIRDIPIPPPKQA